MDSARSGTRGQSDDKWINELYDAAFKQANNDERTMGVGLPRALA